METVNILLPQLDPIPRVVGGSPKTLEEALVNFLPPSGVIKLVREVANETNEPHHHPSPETLFILDGSLTFTWGESGTGTCHPGDRLLLPPNVLHSSTAGPEGCFYIITDKYLVADLPRAHGS